MRSTPTAIRGVNASSMVAVKAGLFERERSTASRQQQQQDDTRGGGVVVAPLRFRNGAAPPLPTLSLPTSSSSSSSSGSAQPLAGRLHRVPSSTSNAVGRSSTSSTSAVSATLSASSASRSTEPANSGVELRAAADARYATEDRYSTESVQRRLEQKAKLYDMLTTAGSVAPDERSLTVALLRQQDQDAQRTDDADNSSLPPTSSRYSAEQRTARRAAVALLEARDNPTAAGDVVVDFFAKRQQPSSELAASSSIAQQQRALIESLVDEDDLTSTRSCLPTNSSGPASASVLTTAPGMTQSHSQPNSNFHWPPVVAAAQTAHNISTRSVMPADVVSIDASSAPEQSWRRQARQSDRTYHQDSSGSTTVHAAAAARAYNTTQVSDCHVSAQRDAHYHAVASSNFHHYDYGTGSVASSVPRYPPSYDDGDCVPQRDQNRAHLDDEHDRFYASSPSSSRSDDYFGSRSAPADSSSATASYTWLAMTPEERASRRLQHADMERRSAAELSTMVQEHRADSKLVAEIHRETEQERARLATQRERKQKMLAEKLALLRSKVQQQQQTTKNEK